jgi:hypothetical protein
MRPEISDTGITVPDMTEPPSRFDVTVTMDHNGSTLQGLAEFAAAARHAAARRNASIAWAQTATRLISIVTVQSANPAAAVAVALAIVSEALARSCRPAADGTTASDLMRWLIERGIPVVLGTARPAPQSHMP